MSDDVYEIWVESWLKPLLKILKPDASVYICGNWETSAILQKVCDRHFNLLNRITIAREKGRGSKNLGKIILKIYGFVQKIKKIIFSMLMLLKLEKKCWLLIK